MSRVTTMPVMTSAESVSIAIAGAVTVYTKAIKLRFGEYFSLGYKAVSASSAPDIKIELEQSVKDVLPATEGASDANYVVAENASAIETSLITESFKLKALSPVASHYCRLKITGAAGNAADTIVTAFLNMTEDF
uniref:Uncharacterized protein n=1 Tax=viral metagenome TaxID=1070528 RepID=A0A6M3IM55_9ZZZZ